MRKGKGGIGRRREIIATLSWLLFPVGGRKYYRVMTSSAEIQNGGSKPEVVVLVFQSIVGVVVTLHKKFDAIMCDGGDPGMIRICGM